jgi:hypothetical protein
MILGAEDASCDAAGYAGHSKFRLIVWTPFEDRISTRRAYGQQGRSANPEMASIVSEYAVNHQTLGDKAAHITKISCAARAFAASAYGALCPVVRLSGSRIGLEDREGVALRILTHSEPSHTR